MNIIKPLALKMNIQLDADFISQYVFQPVYTLAGKLLALELLTRFSSLNGDLAMPTEIGITLLSPEQRIELFNEQLVLVEKHASWFVEYGILLTINIEETIVDLIVSNPQIRQRLLQWEFITFEISESFPDLSAGKNNEQIRLLSEDFTLWLDDFGSGKATLTALYDGLFDYVKINKRFYWRLFTHQGYDVLIDSLLKNINLLCKGVIVCGIEQREYFNKLKNAGVLGLQGFLWPAVGVGNLHSLPMIAREFDDKQ
ncbi:EAL domain-containing protein (putative c-di-GMP-specific phosphodiesterase class I) [Serratia fonticola]|uniref:EAL domain-containing protein (Putative c-di-GMP-specific phosphodiesterase class I) n=1 Tax=Serratia fonticola TaxID=47917 RepID=A0A559TBZ0_SERFO|nr:EAL domain-containing protein (putative c-di-GMP-specific phosphodiesterase class I) [Serratia fonticola]TQI97616.1 EAL domain-containing protein (putative c-di-GMP-specific phosphodiesterase class I) [Serratia fonticola]TVZ72114.1 EAL domain-containing protein (putative c-di-GMP-specific phosphodiesterase class I) [Serratia fonticola]